MSLPLMPRDGTEARKASMPDATAPSPGAAAPATAWTTDSYTRRPCRPATIPAERQAGWLPCDNILNPSRQSYRQSNTSQYQQQMQQQSSVTKNATMSRYYPTPPLLQQQDSMLEHDPPYHHPQQAVYDQQQPQYQAYHHPNFRPVDYHQHQPPPPPQQQQQQKQQQEQPLPWPLSPPRALQMRRDSSRTLAPAAMTPVGLESGIDLALRSFSLSRDEMMQGGRLGPSGGGEGEGGRAPSAVAMMVVMNPPGEGGASQATYSGDTLNGGHNSGRHSSTDSGMSIGKGVLAPPAATAATAAEAVAREEGADAGTDAASRRHRAEHRRFWIMFSLGTVTSIATVALAVFTALNFYSKVQQT